MNEFWEWVYLEIETLGLNYIAWNNEPQDLDDRGTLTNMISVMLRAEERKALPTRTEVSI